jgi:UDP-GlcNAc:undecaprenyl-phosphate GlcNAc-1-phosphate transferase
MSIARLIAILVPFLAAFGLSLIAVPVSRRVAVRLGVVAHPREDRWHRRKVPLFGGVAIAFTFLACASLFGVARELPVLTLTPMAIFVVGLVDDIISLKPATKLIAQIALASVLLLFDYRLHWVESMTLDTLLTLFWVVGLTNAFNLIDNMDGLCGGVALIVGAALLVHVLPEGAGPHALLQARYLAILIGAIGGFLIYNVYPASIFMGDSGSMLLGFSLAAVTVSNSTHAPTRSEILPIVAGPVLVLLFPIFDTTLVTVSRWLSGRHPSQGGRDHSSHRLVAIGLSERRAVALLWMMAAAGGAFGIGVDSFGQRGMMLLAVAVFVLSVVLFATYLAGIRVYEESDERIQQGTLTPIVVEFMYKRRVAEVLLDFCLIVICYYAAFRLRFEDPSDFLRNFAIFLESLPVIVAAQMVSFFAVGVYRGMWRHFGMTDTLVVARGVFLGAGGALLVMVGVFRAAGYSRTVFVIYAVLLLIAVTLSRASLRLVGEFLGRQRRSGRRVVIYGAGDAGGVAVRQVMDASAGTVRVAGFIDDDPRKTGVRIMGYPVLGGYSALTVLIRAASIDGVVISTRRLTPERLNNLEVLCAQHQVELTRLRIALEPLVEGQAGARSERSSTVRQIGS